MYYLAIIFIWYPFLLEAQTSCRFIEDVLALAEILLEYWAEDLDHRIVVRYHGNTCLLARHSSAHSRDKRPGSEKEKGTVGRIVGQATAIFPGVVWKPALHLYKV